MAKRLVGTVVSNRADKTSVVRVDFKRQHPIYSKSYTVSKKMPVHDEKNQCAIGDVVEIVECRPVSKRKRWRLAKIVERAAR